MKKREHEIVAFQEVYEYAFSSVPEDKRKPTGVLALVMFGFALSHSAINIGLRIGVAMPLGQAVGISIAGNAVLFFISLFWGLLGQRTGSTSASLIKKLLGTPISLLFSFCVTLAMIGWMGMNGEWLAAILTDLFPGWMVPLPVAAMLVVAVGVCCSLRGWKSIETIDKILIPLIVFAAIFIVVRIQDGGMAFTQEALVQNDSLSIPAAVIMVIGNYAVSAATVPDLSRFAVHRRSVLGCTVVYTLTLVGCNLCGILLAKGAGVQNLTYGVYKLGLLIPGLIFLAMCTYTTQNVNLYIGSLALQNLLKSTTASGMFSYKMTVLLMGGFAMLVSTVGISKHLATFAGFCVLSVISLTGIALMEAVIGRKRERVRSSIPLMVWLFSVVAGFVAWQYSGGSILVIPMVVICVCVFYILLRKKARRLEKDGAA